MLAIALSLLTMNATAAASRCAATTPVGFAAAAANAVSLLNLSWNPFGRAEIGWSVYAPKVATEIGSNCDAATPAFADRLAAWQAHHRLPANGQFDPPTFAAMKAAWQRERPFAHVASKTSCPPPPPPETLAWSRASEGYGGKLVQLRIGALAAYRAMVAAARRELHGERRAFGLFSGFRDPASDAARCTVEGNCNGIVRATCSAHRTGLAVDMWVGQAPGYGPDSTADVDRAAMVQTPAYRWLLVNARRFGFVNYVFEPWHWEWTGEPI